MLLHSMLPAIRPTARRCLTLSAFALASAPAWAQADTGVGQDEEPELITLEDEELASPPRAAPTVIEEIIVTAGRTGDTLADTPISVSVTGDVALRETNITDVEVLSDRLPNAQLAMTPTNTFMFVRGLGSGGVRSAEQSVGFFVDNVFLGRPQVALFDFLDVRQVELLRGPQGAILGKNTVAGAVNVQTAEVTYEPEAYLEALYGSDNATRIRGAVSGALGENVAARLAYSRTDEDGYLYNTTQQRTDLARPGHDGRLKLQWDPNDYWSTGLSIQSARIRQTGDSFELSQISSQTLELYRQFDPETSTDITDNRTHTDHTDSGALIEGLDIIANAQWSPDFGLFRFVASRSNQETTADFDLDISPAPFLNFPSLEDYQQHSAELRFDTEFLWGDVSVGLYYFQADLDLQVDINAFRDGTQAFALALASGSSGIDLSPLAQALRFEDGSSASDFLALGSGRSRHHLIQRQTTYSAFGSVRGNISERLTLRADLRVTRESKDADQSIVHSGASGPLIGAALGEEEYELIATRAETDFSPRLSLLADINDSISGYVTLARGFKSGGFNNLAAVPDRAEFDEERSLTYEAGLRLFTNFGLSGSLALFRTDFENLQVAALDGTEFFVGNAAKAHTQGIELSAEWMIGLFSVGAELGLLDAQYDSYPAAPPRADQDEDSQDLSGRVLMRAPRYSGSLQLGMRAALPLLGWPMMLGMVAEGASHQFLNIDLDPIDSQPGYVRYNAFFGFTGPQQRYSFKLIGRNLGDKTVRREAADVAIVGAHSVGVFPPRAIVAEIAYRFP